MSITQVVATYFPRAAEKMRQSAFSHRLTSMVDQGYAGAFVAAHLVNPGTRVYKYEGAVPTSMTSDAILGYLKKICLDFYGTEPRFSEIHVLDKNATAAFNRRVYFEMELSSRAFMIICVDKELADRMQEYLRVVTGRKIKTNTIVMTDQGVGVSSKEFAVADMRMPDPLFYPYLEEKMEDLWAEFMGSDAPLMIGYGPAGTGKTTFGRGMAVHCCNSVYLVTNPKVFDANDPFAPYYSDSDAALMITEEMDSYLAPRDESGRDSGVVSSLLNYTQGFSDEVSKKILLNTNLTNPTNQIDHALMREGRCFRVIKFRNLTHKEACNLAEERKIADFFAADARDSWSLAQVLNFKKTRRNDKGEGAGFLA